MAALTDIEGKIITIIVCIDITRNGQVANVQGDISLNDEVAIDGARGYIIAIISDSDISFTVRFWKWKWFLRPRRLRG